MLNVTFFRKQTVFGWSWYCDWLSLFITASKKTDLFITCNNLLVKCNYYLFWIFIFVLSYNEIRIWCDPCFHFYPFLRLMQSFVLTLSVSFYIVIHFWHYLFSFLEIISRKRVIIPDSRENKDTKNTKKIELSVLHFNDLNTI